MNVAWIPYDFATTHETSGLPGYPARDFFASPGALVRLRFRARVERLSGRDACAGGVPGGAYGRSVYVRSIPDGRSFFLTHLCCVAAVVGDVVPAGNAIATVADARRAGKPGSSHVHVGRQRR